MSLFSLLAASLLVAPALTWNNPSNTTTGLGSDAALPPSITGIDRTDAPLSGLVEITGSGFGSGGPSDAVYVAGLDAPTSTWTDTRIVAYVPETALPGPATVVVVVQGATSNAVSLTVNARSSSGRIRWTFEAEGDSLWWRPALAPDGTIYLHGNSDTDGLVYALSPEGGLKWIQKVNWYPYVPPSAGPDGAVYVGSIARIYRIGPSGEIDWQFYDPGSPGPRVSPTVGPDGLLYGAFDAGIGAFSMEPLTGQLVWSNPGNPPMHDKSGQATEARFGPAGSGLPVDQFYVSMDGGAGFYAFSLGGSQLFTSSLWNITGTAEAAVGQDGTIYGPRSLGLEVVALDPMDGSTSWVYYPGPNQWATGTDNVEIGPDEMLYFVGSGGKLEAFDPGRQSRRWQAFTAGTVLDRPTISPDGSVLVVNGVEGYGQPGFTRGYNPGNGKLLWTVDLGGAAYPQPRSVGVHHARITPDSTTAYVSTATLGASAPNGSAHLFAIDVTSGKGGGGKGGGKGKGKR
jgi:hypothetical protein